MCHRFQTARVSQLAPLHPLQPVGESVVLCFQPVFIGLVKILPAEEGLAVFLIKIGVCAFIMAKVLKLTDEDSLRPMILCAVDVTYGFAHHLVCVVKLFRFLVRQLQGLALFTDRVQPFLDPVQPHVVIMADGGLYMG